MTINRSIWYRLLASLSIVLSAPAWAEGHAFGHVAELAFSKTYGNIVFIRLDSPNSVPSAPCGNNGYWQFVLTLQSTVDKGMYAALLAAQLSGKAVQLDGTGTCTDVGAIESLNNLNIYP